MICKRCEYYDMCLDNDFKHKLTKHNLPVFNICIEETLTVFNEIKCGINYSRTDFGNLPNKISELLIPMTNAINEKQNRDLNERQNKAQQRSP